MRDDRRQQLGASLPPIAVDLSAHGRHAPREITCTRRNHGGGGGGGTADAAEGGMLRVRVWGRDACAEIAVMPTGASSAAAAAPRVSLLYDARRSSVRVRLAGSEDAAPAWAAPARIGVPPAAAAAAAMTTATFTPATLPVRFAPLYRQLASAVVSIRARLPRLAILTPDASLAVLLDDGPTHNSFTFSLRLAGPSDGVWRVHYWPRRSHLCLVTTPWGASHTTYLSRSAALFARQNAAARAPAATFSQLSAASAALLPPPSEASSGVRSALFSSPPAPAPAPTPSAVLAATLASPPTPLTVAADLPLSASSVLALALRQHAL